jgi:hypothetical protein
MLTRGRVYSYQQNRDVQTCHRTEKHQTEVGLVWDDDEGTIDTVDTTPDVTFGQLIAESWGSPIRAIRPSWCPARRFAAPRTRLARIFRRGCWLSGCPIEASAHEKAEWIQGFSREEIEAWNLKM